MAIPSLPLADGGSIPQLALGTWELTGSKCVQAVEAALELGYTHIDTADLYNNHRDIAKAISGRVRESFFLTSKVWHSNLKGPDVLKCAQRFLRELNTPYLDLLLIHWPNRGIPLSSTLPAFEQLLAEGKIRHFGVSNCTPRHIADIRKAAPDLPICCEQVEFHPMFYQKELLEYCKADNLVLEAYSPLGRAQELKRSEIAQIAAKHDKTPAQVVLRWELDLGIVPLPKASSRAHLAENLDVFDFKLDEGDKRTLESLPQKRLVDLPLLGDFNYQ
ncbi:Aldo/keto reductase family protein [uncultured archaeon]|nr:Aldo/keto reductase family protein [uncultured archaeon]